ncbi:MAG: hypothetical protein D6820_00255 [Lentisphaerae bacterium]|nr:MAG: hypothetical protein D6820_00255 [Lentisphaerota bacterium]
MDIFDETYRNFMKTRPVHRCLELFQRFGDRRRAGMYLAAVAAARHLWSERVDPARILDRVAQELPTVPIDVIQAAVEDTVGHIEKGAE